MDKHAIAMSNARRMWVLSRKEPDRLAYVRELADEWEASKLDDMQKTVLCTELRRLADEHERS